MKKTAITSLLITYILFGCVQKNYTSGLNKKGITQMQNTDVNVEFNYFDTSKNNAHSTEYYFNSHVKKNTLFMFFQTGQPKLTINKEEETKKNTYFKKFNLIPILSGCHKLNANAEQYNRLLFKYLTAKHGNKWQKNIPNNAIGYSNWKKVQLYFTKTNDTIRVFKSSMLLTGFLNFKTGEEEFFSETYTQYNHIRGGGIGLKEHSKRCKNERYITPENKIKTDKLQCKYKDSFYCHCHMIESLVSSKLMDLVHESILVKEMFYPNNLQDFKHFHDFYFEIVDDKLYQRFTINGANKNGESVNYKSAFIFIPDFYR